MTDRAAVDTNAVILLVNRKLHPRSFGFDEIPVPTMVVGELFFGAYNSTRIEDNRRRMLSFLDQVTIMDLDLETTEFYGRIKAQTRRIGKGIPDNDAWIAAAAMQYDLPLVTNDHHFDRVEGLITIPWQLPS